MNCKAHESGQIAHHLHGGHGGFHERMFEVEKLTENGVVLTYLSPAGEDKYPSEVKVTVTYTLEKNEEGNVALGMDYHAALTEGQTTPTPINLTNHTYWNLEGHEK